jgi:hypothetical protein
VGKRHTGSIDGNRRGHRLPTCRVCNFFEHLSYSATGAGRLKRSNHFLVAIQLHLY